MDFEVIPSDTDHNITDLLNGQGHAFKHQILSGDAPPSGLLFLYMPGHGRHSVQDAGVLKVADQAGHHVIGLEYMNIQDNKCGDCSDCYYAARSTLLYGYDHSSTIHINEPDSILNRLTKLLEWLVVHHPTEQWSQFLVGGDPAWGKIVVAGHSQGGGEAALIAMEFLVPRVVMFASVVDAVHTPSGLQSAQWLQRLHLTPIDRYFGFTNLNDGFNPKTQTNWTTLGMLGSPTSVDSALPPYGGAHQLTSSTLQANPHIAVVKDSTYQSVWEYLVA